MKKIFFILCVFLICLSAAAQDVVYSESLLRKAESGDLSSMTDLGYCYERGLGIKRNKPEAVKWYQKAAENNSVNGMFFLASSYLRGMGVKKDYRQAIKWFKKGAERGDKYSMNMAGYMYRYGYGTDKNYSKSTYWYTRAAELGEEDSMGELAWYFESGDYLLPKNKEFANILYSAQEAAKAGNKSRAQQLLSKVLPELKKPRFDNSNPPVLQIVPGSIVFSDASGNNAVDAGEKCRISFKLKNIGKGGAYDCVAKVSSSVRAIGGGETEIGMIGAGDTRNIEVEFDASMNTDNGKADIAVSVIEPNDFGCDPVTLTVDTRSFVHPMLKIVDYTASADEGGVLRKMHPFKLEVLLQNTEHGNAEDVNVCLKLPDNVVLMDGEGNTSIEKIGAGDNVLLKYTLIANNAYNGPSIPVKVDVREKFGKYAESRTIDLAMNASAGGQHVVLSAKDEKDDADIEIARIDDKKILADVDENIPLNSITNDNTFVVIIANENYENESGVEYALNDGRMFRVYCERVLGIPAKNIRMAEDATLNNILVNLDWLKNVSDSFSDANIIFYYAGHGFPDTRTGDAYLLPADGYGASIRTGYKLENLYSELGAMKSDMTLVFMDACFSGAKRSGGMMESDRAVGIRPRAAAPKGNMVVFSASQGNETAYPYKEKQHGLFTYFLLKKLQESEGNVSLGDLSSYVTTNVKRVSAINNAKLQTPTVQFSSSMMDKWKDVMIGVR